MSADILKKADIFSARKPGNKPPANIKNKPFVNPQHGTDELLHVHILTKKPEL